jgi:hypothetical protein
MAKKILAQGVLDSNNVLWSSKALTATNTYNSAAIKTEFSEGNTALVVSTTASITIYFHVSPDASTWYTPYDQDGNDLSIIGIAIAADRYIAFNPQLAKYISFSVYCNNNATTTLKFIQQEA